MMPISQCCFIVLTRVYSKYGGYWVEQNKAHSNGHESNTAFVFDWLVSMFSVYTTDDSDSTGVI